MLLLAAALALAACSKPASRELQAGSYRATLELPGSKTVPFGLDVAQEETGKVLYVINGDERIRLDEVAVTPDQLQARFPGYETTLSAKVRDGELTGDVTLVHADGKVLQLPFTAQLGETWRFYPDALAGQRGFRRTVGRDVHGRHRSSDCRRRDVRPEFRRRDGNGADAHGRPAFPGRRGP